MNKSISVAVLLALGLAVLLSVAGCAQMFTSSTEANYQLLPDGTKIITYKSDKELQGVDVDIQENKDGKSVKIKVEKSNTLESVVAATLQMNLQLLKQLEALTQKAATVAPVPIKP